MSNILDGVQESLEVSETSEKEIKEEPKEELPKKEDPEPPKPIEEKPVEEPVEQEKPTEEPIEEPEVDTKDQKISDLNKALASERAKRRELSSVSKEEEPLKEEKPVYDESSVEKLVKQQVEKAKAEFLSINIKDVETKAQQTIYDKYPKLLDDNTWAEVVSYYTPHFGKKSVEDEIKNIELAVANFEHITGKKVSSIQEGVKEGDKAASNIANLPSGSPAGDQHEAELTPEQKEAARKGGVSEKEYKKFSGKDTFEIPIHEDSVKY